LGWIEKNSFHYDTTAESAEWIDEAPRVTTRQSTLADFGSMRFTHMGYSAADPATAHDTSTYMVHATTDRIIAYPGKVVSTTTDSFTDTAGTPLQTVTLVTPSHGSTSGGTVVDVTGVPAPPPQSRLLPQVTH